ncbi:hypothetical protein ACFYVR_25055 [Rhodococcus sp. NPDC003318]|uniref:hypothetical protein n=1 Tax=Rhodococcus sp. NPDC003318 TaxID=3364503 RepID=UPI0036C24419
MTGRRTAAGLTLAASALLIAGCGSDESPVPALPTATLTAPDWPPRNSTASAPATALPTVGAEVDRTSPSEVGQAVVETWFSYDTRADENRNDAAARAAALLTPELRAQVTGGGQGISPGADWRDWQAEGAVVTATATEQPNQGQANTDTKYHAVFEVVQTVTAASGAVLETSTSYVAVVVSKTTDGWSVASVTTL